MKTITNGEITISVKEHGAELASLQYQGREYLWGADEKFWKRHSPVLFPIVGSVWNGQFRSQGNTYPMGQHGFARDLDFTLLTQSDTELRYVLESTPDTLARYPYPFRLEIGYKLSGKSVEVIWQVTNTGTQEMAFQIGAHPAFHWPLLSDETLAKGTDAMIEVLLQSTNRGWFQLDAKTDTVRSSVIRQAGCVSAQEVKEVSLTDGYLPLNTHTFDEDALILEYSQVTRVTLCRADKTPYLTLRFKAPLVGLWSPPGKNAPFVCIEPWYGRTDSIDYNGEYEQRVWMNHLSPGSVFNASYTIEIE